MAAAPVHQHLATQVFLIETYDDKGDPCHGTGFFVSPEYALTAFHNISESVKGDSAVRIDAQHEGRTIEFVWALPDEKHREWQKQYDIAVLKAEAPLLEAPALRGGFLDSKWKGAARENQWARRDIVVIGYPGHDGQHTIGGRTAVEGTLAEAHWKRGGVVVASIPAALSMIIEQDGLPKNLGGLSGAPVLDQGSNHIVGVVVAAGQQLKASELVHVVEHWPEAHQFLEELPPLASMPYRTETRSIRGTAMVLSAVFGLLALGAGAWYGVRWARTPKDLAVSLVREANAAKEKASDNGTLAEGEKVRISITSPATGYLYIVDQEITRDGKYREPTLLFPNQFTPDDRKRVSAGSVVFYPDPNDNPPTIEPAPSGSDYAGELLTVMVFNAPLPIHPTGATTPVTVEQIPEIEVTAPNPEGNPRRLILSAPTPPLSVKKVKFAVRRSPSNATAPGAK